MKILGQVITWGSTLFVIRLLLPEDYGLMAMATVVISLLSNINEMGLESAIVQKKDLEKKLIEKVFGLLILFNIVLFGLIYLVAPYIADFFNDDRLIPMVRILGVLILLSPFHTIPDAIMTRNMDFRRISLIQFFSQIIASITTLIFAFYGAGVWSLIYGQLTLAMAATIGTIVVSRYLCIPRFNFSGIGSVLNFGGFVTLQSLLYTLFARADEIVIGKLLGKEILGYYAVAMRLASLPLEKFNAILNEIGFSAFSQIQDKQSMVQDHLCKAIRILGVIVFPVFFGISSIAPELVSVVIGEKWQTSVLPLQILSIAMALRMMNVTDPVLNALGRPDAGAKVFAIGCVIMPVAFLIGAQWGLVGVSLAWLFAYPLHFYITLRIALPIIGMTLLSYVREFIYPAVISMFMYATVILAKHTIIPSIGQPILELIFLISVGGLTYTVLIFLFQRSSTQELLSMVRG